MGVEGLRGQHIPLFIEGRALRRETTVVALQIARHLESPHMEECGRALEGHRPWCSLARDPRLRGEQGPLSICQGRLRQASCYVLRLRKAGGGALKMVEPCCFLGLLHRGQSAPMILDHQEEKEMWRPRSLAGT